MINPECREVGEGGIKTRGKVEGERERELAGIDLLFKSIVLPARKS